MYDSKDCMWEVHALLWVLHPVICRLLSVFIHKLILTLSVGRFGYLHSWKTRKKWEIGRSHGREVMKRTHLGCKLNVVMEAYWIGSSQLVFFSLPPPSILQPPSHKAFVHPGPMIPIPFDHCSGQREPLLPQQKTCWYIPFYPLFQESVVIIVVLIYSAL